MFHSKQDVDRHVNDVFKNIKSEYQRNLKCYQIAKLYYKFKDYKSAIKYINRYILTTSNSAAAHRLLGECYLGINLKIKALDSFKTSLELNGSQTELVLKVCSLLMDPEVSAVTPRATYWLERAESLFPTNSVVFRLKEHLLKSNLEEKQENGELEKLMLSEISARPTDVTVRIRLLNFFVDTKRFKIAYQHALDIEERNGFSNDIRWYDCLCNLFQAYEKGGNELNFSFFVRKLLFYEKRVDLYMQEFQDEVKSLPECSSALFAFDQNLHLFSKIDVPHEETHFFNEFLKHMRAQLAFHLATLALKRAQKEYGIWSKAFSTASPLLLIATHNTMNIKDAWYNLWPGKNKMERVVKLLSKSAAFRISQAGHILLAWSQHKGSKFLEKVSQFCGGKWQTHVYQNIFYNNDHRQATATSHFINDTFFANIPMQLLNEAELNHFDDISQSAYPDSLHHLVWLGLAYCDKNGQLNHDFRCMTVPELQFTVENLSQFGPETLNQLDVDAFLYASVLCAKSAAPTIISPDRPTKLPVSISEELCSAAQSDWWVAVYKTYRNQPDENMADRRLKLRKGIESIRAFGHHGLHVKVLVMLAKLFQERAAKNKNPNELNGLEERAHLYWTAAIPLLEKLEKNQQLREVPNRLFDYRGKDLTPNEIKGYLEDGRLFVACRFMKQGRHEHAIEAFQLLKSPYATFYQGLIYEKLASEEVSHRPESITSENRSQHIILLTRARDAFYLTLDRLRCPSVDQNHPLNAQLQDHLEQIEKQLRMIDPDTAMVHHNGDSESDETDIAPGPLSPDTEEHVDTSFNVYNTSNIVNIKNHSTIRNRQNLSEKHPSFRFEARPSPERLDAQLRHLMQANSSGLHAVIDILKDIKSVMQIELKDLRCVTRDLLAEMKKLGDRFEASKRDVLKAEDLLELREEDYEDLNQFSQYAPYTNYHLNRPPPITQATSAAYGTSVSAIPPISSTVPNSDNPSIPHTFYPGGHSVPSVDPNLLLYQTLGYYAQGMPGYGENQNISDYKGTGILKGAPFAKNNYRAPDSMASTNTLNSKPQPPNVVITSSDTLPAFTNAGTPVMSVTIPPQHIRGLIPSPMISRQNQSQVHPYQIPMPPQAQLVKESPMEKLDSAMTSTSLFTNTVQTPAISSIELSQMQQKTWTEKDLKAAKSESSKTTATAAQEQNASSLQVNSDDEIKLFEASGKLSIMTEKEWEELGMATIKILQNKNVKKARIDIFLEETLRKIGEHYITPEMNLESLKLRENGWIWCDNNMHKTDFKPNEMSVTKYRVQFNSFDEAKDFEYAFNEGRKMMKEKSKSEISKAGTLKTFLQNEKRKCKFCESLIQENGKCSCETKEKTKLGGFTFSSPPVFKPPISNLKENEEKQKEVKPSPFMDFSFSSISKTSMPLESVSEPRGLFNNKKTGDVGTVNTFSNLFAAVKSDPNSFKKDANFKGFEGKDSLVFEHLNKSKVPSSDLKDESALKTKVNEDNENGDDEFVPTAEFTPVVDLPELVDIKTGEENDKVLFEERAKLLRFDKDLKEWKERGIGAMKILLNEDSGKVRLIMRRELVLKVCCNHYLDEKTEFKRLTKSEKALTWCAQDYSEGELKSECFALRFKSPESMVRFENVLKDTQSKMKNGHVGETTHKKIEDGKPEILKPLSELFKPKAGSWECPTCLIRNNENVTKCVSCETGKPGTEDSHADASTNSSSLGKGIVFPPSTTKFSFGVPQVTSTASVATSTPQFTFGIPATTTASINATLSLKTPQTGTTSASETSTAKFTFGSPSLETVTVASSSTKFTFGTSAPSMTPSTTLASTPNFSFGIPKPSISSASTTSVSSVSSAFTLGKTSPSNSSTPSVTATLPKPTFSLPSFTTLSTKPKGEAFQSKFNFNIQKADEKTESGSPQTSFSFTSAVKPEGKSKFEFSWSNRKPMESTWDKSSPSFKEKQSENDGSSDGSEEEAEDNNEDHTIVTPVFPLPEKVPVHTGEEDEDVIYEKKAKLFRFTDKEWKERGIGNIKILRHKINKKIRLLMRREIILKVCLNQYVTSEIEFIPRDEKTWQWSAPDFTEGEVKIDTFAIRFKTPEIAQEFKTMLEDIKNNPEQLIKSEVKEKPKESSTTAMKNFTFAVPNAPKSETSKSLLSGDEDILVVYENKVTAEQREKAMSLHLPPNFYAYLQAPDCPGCPGCEKDDAPQSNSPPDSTTSLTAKSTFGNVPWGSLNFGESENSEGKLKFTFGGNQAATKRKPAEPILSEDVEDEENDEEDGGENDDDEDDAEDDEEGDAYLGFEKVEEEGEYEEDEEERKED